MTHHRSTLAAHGVLRPPAARWDPLRPRTLFPLLLAVLLGLLAGSGLDASAQAPPTLVTPPEGTTNILGSTALFVVGASGAEPLRYQWLFNSTAPVAGATNSALTIALVQPGDAGSYSVVITNLFGSVTSSPAPLRVLLPPKVVSQPSSQTLTPGQAVGFVVGAIGETPLAYQWFFNLIVPIPNATNSTLLLTNIQPSDSGHYLVVVTNAYGIDNSSEAELIVQALPGIVQSPSSLVVTQGQTARFTVQAGGGEPLFYNWLLNDALLPGATNATLSLTNVGPSAAGSYVARVTNLVGSARSAAATLAVRIPPSLLLGPTNQAAPRGGTVTWVVQAAGDEPFTYQWVLEQTNSIPGATNASLTLTNLQASAGGGYTVRIGNGAGVLTTPEAVLTVVQPPVLVTPPAGLAVTQGDAATLSVSAGGTAPFSFQWLFNSSPVPDATNTSLVFVSAQASDAGSYSVVVTNLAGAVTSDPVQLVVRVAPVILQQPLNAVTVLGGGAEFSVLVLGDEPLAYQWLFNGSTPLPQATNNTLRLTNVQAASLGLYSVQVTNAAGSLVSRQAILSTKQPPSITRPPASLVVTQGSPVLFSVGVSGDGPLVFQWSFNETNRIVGATSPTLLIPSAQGSAAGRYSVQVTNEAGGAASLPATLSVRIPPSIQAHPTNLAVTPGSTAAFQVTASGDAALRYQWLFNGTNLLGNATNATLSLPEVQPAAEGFYSVIVSNPVGSLISSNAELRVRAFPTIVQQPSSLVVTQGQAARFSLQPGGDGPFTYEWLFNGTTLVSTTTAPSLTVPNVQAANAGVYSVRVLNPVGAVLSADATLVIRLIPAFVQQPASLNLAPGSNATFSVLVTGDAPLTYQWFFNQTNALAGATNRALLLANVQVAEAGRYSVFAANPFGSGVSLEATLAVRLPPSILQQPVSLSSTQSQPASFSVVAGGDGPMFYQWFFNGTILLPGATGPTFALPSAQPAHIGTYSVRVTNLTGSILSAPAGLSLQLLPLITRQPSSLVATQGVPASFTVSANSDTPLTHQWRLRGSPLPGQTTATLLFNSPGPTDPGPYDVVFANAAGSVTSTVATLTVLGLDFGDAPAPYPTLQAADGARHVFQANIFLGTTVAVNVDGQPDPTAAGDVNAVGTEEDGVVFLSPTRVGQTVNLRVLASIPGLLNAWVDFNRSGDWSQAGDQIFTNQALFTGTNQLTFEIPSTAAAGVTFARFRFSTAGNLGFTGLAPDGEVEDYPLTLLASADLGVVARSSVPSLSAGSNVVYTLTVTNRGPSSASGVRLTNVLSSRSTFLSAAAGQGACSPAGGTVVCDLGPLATGASAVVTVTARTSAGANTLLAAVGGPEFDSGPGNNTASATSVATLTLPDLSNTDAIVLPLVESGPGSVYPSRITVAGVTSAVQKVVVTLRNINHDLPDDIDILLVGPHGQATYLMSDSGLDNALVDVTLTFDDDAAQGLPDAGPLIVSGRYRPSNYGATPDPFAPPAPAGGYATNLAIFANTDPNGVWSLYVMDDQPDNATAGSSEGFIADGWSLTLITGDPLAELGLSQTPPLSSALAGVPTVFNFGITNRGPAASTAVLTAPLPPGMTVSSFTAGQGGCSQVNGTAICDLGTLPAGGRTTLSLSLVAAIGGTSDLTFTLSGNQRDPDLSNNVLVNRLTVVPQADLMVDTTVTGSAPLLGQAFLYFINVTNLGPSLATGVVVTNPVPAGLTFLTSTTSQGACTNFQGILSCVVGNLAAGASARIQVGARPAQIGALSNFVVASSSQADPVPANNTFSSFITVLPAADLALVATTPVSTISVGQVFTYSFAITNRGPSSATVTFTNRPPAASLFVTASSSRGACTLTSGGLSCPLGLLSPGESATVGVTANFSTLGSFTNTATLLTSVTDPTPADLLATNTVVVVLATDLEVAITDRPDPIWFGENGTYTITVTNRGPNAATAVQLTNQLPVGATLISFTLSQGSCARRGNELDCALGNIPAGARVVLGLVVRPDSLNSITTTAAAFSGGIPDLAPANNESSQTTRVVNISGIASSSTPITIPRVGLSDPYPSTLNVAGFTTAVASVRVTLTNLNHSFSDDLDILLVGPNGRAVILMSDAGGEFPLNSAAFVFDDNAPGALADNGPLINGLVRPSNYGLDPDLFPPPAPAGPYETRLSVFNGIDPNGSWSLYIVDDADKDAGTLSGGWNLSFAALDPIANLVLSQSLTANPVAVSSNLVITYSVTNRGPAVATDVRLTNTVPPLFKTTVTSISTSLGSCGFAGGQLVCSFGDLPPGVGALITVSGSSVVTGTVTNIVSIGSPILDLQPENNTVITGLVFENPPLITLQPVSRVITNGDSVQFTAAAIGTGPLSYQWSQNGVDLPGTTSPALRITNATAAAAGSYRLRVSNRVATATTDPAQLTVLGPPTIAGLQPIAIDEDTATGPIPFTVSDAESPAASILVSADSLDHALVPAANLVVLGTGSARTVQVTPLPNASGIVSILIIARDPDGGVSVASFPLTIRPIEDPPVLGPIADQQGTEDTPKAVPFTALDPDVPSDQLIYTARSSNPALLPPGNVLFSGSGSNRIATLTPALDASGSATLTFTVSDSEGMAVERSFQFTVAPVNDPPTLAPIANVTVDEDAGPQVVALLGIGSGASNEVQRLTVTARSANPALLPHPVVSYASPDRTGTLTFAPLPDASGSIPITVTVRDGGASNNTVSRTFTVTIAPTNDPPTLANILNTTTDEDTPVSVPVTIGDAESPASTLTLTASSSNTNLVPNASLVFTGSGSERGLTLTPAPNQSGVATIIVTVSDPNHATATDAFVLTVNPVNDAPTLNPMNDLTVARNAATQTVNLSGIGSGATNEIQTLTITAVSANPAVVTNPVVNYTSPAATGTLTFRPVTNAVGNALITVTISDGQALNPTLTRTFNITVTPTNAAPVLSNVVDVVIDEDTSSAPVPFNIRDAETAADSLILTASSSNTNLIATNGVAFGGSGTNRTITMTPARDQFGTALITISLRDPQGATTVRSFRLTVRPVNDAPTLAQPDDVLVNQNSGPRILPLAGISAGPANESATQVLAVTATTADTNLLSSLAVSYNSPESGGTLLFQPVQDAFGTATITVTVNDGQAANATASRTFSVRINPAPAISDLPDLVTPEDTPAGPIPVTLSDADTPASLLTLMVTSSNPVLLPDANLFLRGAGNDRTLVLVPVTNLSGAATLTLTATDTNGAATTRQFLLTVDPVVDTIQITAQPASVTTSAGQPATFSVAAVSGLPLFFQWQRNSLHIPGATSSSFSLPEVQPGDSSSLQVLISNEDTAAASVVATLQVVGRPPVPRIVGVERTGDSVSVSFTTTAQLTYVLEYKNTLNDLAWTLVGSATGTGSTVSIVDPNSTIPTRFYRVQIR